MGAVSRNLIPETARGDRRELREVKIEVDKKGLQIPSKNIDFDAIEFHQVPRKKSKYCWHVVCG